VHFDEVIIEGATAFPAAELAPLFESVLKRDTTMADVVIAVNRVSQHYSDANYIFCTVVLPKQDLNSRKLHLVVVEGFVSDVEIGEGIKSEAVRERVRSVVSTLVGRKPIRRGDLERRLLIAADTAGLTLSAGARPTGSDK